MNGLGQSPSSSSGVTPTQPISELPRTLSPSRKPPLSLTSTSTSPFTTNGFRQGLNTSMRGVLPFPTAVEQSPRTARRYGRESAPPGKASASHLSNGVHHVPTPRRHNSAQYSHMSIPEAKEEEEEGEEEGEEERGGDGRVGDLANTGVGGVMDSQVPTMPPGARLKNKKRERRREGDDKLQQQQQISSDVKQDGVEWTLVDDRSLSVDDEESEEGEVSGLGDGLMDAIATLSESDAYVSGVKKKEEEKASGGRGLSSVNGSGSRNGTSGVLGSREVTPANAAVSALALASPRSNVSGANGRGRRKRKARERGEGVDNKLAFLSSSAGGNDTTTAATATIINGTSPSNGTGDTAAVDASGPTTLHTLNLNTNVTSSYSSPSSSGFPPPPPLPEIARAPSSSSASSRSYQQHHRLHSTGIPSISTAEVRTALMQTYDGNRGRVGVDNAVTLGEEELKAEIVNLINVSHRDIYRAMAMAMTGFMLADHVFSFFFLLLDNRTIRLL